MALQKCKQYEGLGHISVERLPKKNVLCSLWIVPLHWESILKWHKSVTRASNPVIIHHHLISLLDRLCAVVL